MVRDFRRAVDNYAANMETEGSSPGSQKSNTGPSLRPSQSIPSDPLPSLLLLGFLSILFHRGLPF